ncbi:hypothetical protein CKO28_14635 [Rhodovibrio sodomensis]|uniref:Uncharacterized protein n=1 Tax=Rhodovibrio sodomensis TaxID=1088 RepID=A0ABS1DFM6_9PROT|nr:hypothetical protein [Rhodovibrio sodomensis]MBK1669271.1 hypothetical protein [Rhodovibrio sodomensis]
MSIATFSHNARIDGRTGAALLIAAAAALVAWEIFARAIAPVWIGGPLQPTGLVKSLFANVLGLPVGQAAAQAVHLATGLLVYPAGYLAATRIKSLGWAADGAVLGAATWFFALGIVAPVSGLPFLLGVGAITWAALAGHLIYGLVVTGGFALARKRLG